jgi:hypothetical protein
MKEQYVPGRLYRAITSDELVELEPSIEEGLKLRILPEQVHTLKDLQKALRAMVGRKPDLCFVINGLIALSDDPDLQAIADWIKDNRPQEEKDNKSQSQRYQNLVKKVYQTADTDND